MTLLQSKDGTQNFTFEHSREYQQVQFKFLDAVRSMDPNNIVVKMWLNSGEIVSATFIQKTLQWNYWF